MKNFRVYGGVPYRVALLHGGPGAPGQMKPVAEELSKEFGVLEPLQTKATIEGQILELKEVLEEKVEEPIILAGWSWGAWLAVLFTAEYGEMVRHLVLLSSPPFTKEYAKNIRETRLARLSYKERVEFKGAEEALERGVMEEEKALFGELAELTYKADSYNPLVFERSTEDLQPDIFRGVWGEAEILRRNGKLLQKCKSIKCGVAAIHGDYDPHPYNGVEKPLSETLHSFKMIKLEKCGHYPWLEKEAKESFYKALKELVRE